jgi:hypothetical protein
MATPGPRYSKEEFARRADEVFEREIRCKIADAPKNHFVVFDVDTGAFEVDEDESAASNRLYARVPDAQPWVRRVGSRFARHFGGHRRGEQS